MELELAGLKCERVDFLARSSMASIDIRAQQ